MAAVRDIATPLSVDVLEVPPHLPVGPQSTGAPTPARRLAARVLWEQRSVITKAVLYGTALFLLIAFLIPSSFESSTRLMPLDGQLLNALAAANSLGAVSGNLMMAEEWYERSRADALLVRLLHSDSVADNLIDRFDLRRVYRTSTFRSARKQLAYRTQIDQNKNSGLVTITVSDHDPQRASAIAQAYIQQLNTLIANLDTSSAHRERIFLEERLKTAKQELDESSAAFSNFASTNTTVDIAEQDKTMVGAVATLQGQAIATEADLRALEQIYALENVRVRTARARLLELNRQLHKLAGNSGASADEGGSDAPFPSLRQLPVLGVPYADLYRKLKTSETVYEALTEEYEAARLEEAREVRSVTVIDPARLPEKRSGPPRTLITLGGTLLSFCIACAWLFTKQAWDTADPYGPRRMLAQEIAATISEYIHWKRPVFQLRRDDPSATNDRVEASQSELR